MTRSIGFALGVIALLAAIFGPLPEGLSREGFIVAGLVVLMAAWWITEALPLTATALVPFLVLPFAGVMDAKETASAYYSPILFLILGGAFIALRSSVSVCTGGSASASCASPDPMRARADCCWPSWRARRSSR